MRVRDVLLIFLVSQTLIAGEFSLSSGTLRFTSSDGRNHVVPSGGPVSEYSVSPSGQLLATLEKTTGDRYRVRLRDASAFPFSDHIQPIDAVDYKEFSLSVGGKFDWSADSSMLYFLAQFSSTESVLARVRVRSGDVASLTPVGSFAVINCGKYQGSIIALIRKFTLVRPWTWYWLLDRDGNELQPIGEDADVDTFLASIECLQIRRRLFH
jgi:hypothetical protein